MSAAVAWVDRMNLELERAISDTIERRDDAYDMARYFAAAKPRVFASELAPVSEFNAARMQVIREQKRRRRTVTPVPAERVAAIGGGSYSV